MNEENNAAVTWSIDGHLAVVRMSRPDERNAMTRDLRDGLATALASIKQGSDVRALILTGVGPAFSAGGDLDFMRSLPEKNPVDVHQALAAIYPPFIDLLRLPFPSIAAVNGPAVGGGFGIALLCDIRIASQSAVFSAPFGAVGLPPGMGLTFLLPLLLGHGPAMDLLLTSRALRADEAAQRGIVSKVVEDDALMDEALRVGRRIAQASPAVMRTMVEEMRSDLLRGVEDSLRKEIRAQALAVWTPDYAEALDAILEGRQPEFRTADDRQ